MAIGRQRATTERIHVMMKAETRVTEQHAKGYQDLPAVTRSQESAMGQPPSEGTNPADTLILDFQPPDL